jgi:hypothetical protein
MDFIATIFMKFVITEYLVVISYTEVYPHQMKTAYKSNVT